MSRVRRISSSDDDIKRSRRRLERQHVGSNQIGTEERDRVDINNNVVVIDVIRPHKLQTSTVFMLYGATFLNKLCNILLFF